MNDNASGESVESEGNPSDDGKTLLDGDNQGDQGNQDGAEGNQGASGEGEGEGSSNSNEQESNVPDEYTDFQTPEGVELDNELLASANPLFKELGLSQEQAQKLVDFQSAQVQAQSDQLIQQTNTWKEAAKTDSEFGGQNFDENIGKASTAIDQFFSQEFKTLLNNTGLGNHPEVIRGFVKIGKQLAEDNPGSGNASQGEKSRAEKLYGTE
jgi:hypothetical protein